jgi:trk system potassium uptake protein TrkA
MHIVVVGCGRVGTELSVALEAAGHTVSVIDRSKSAFRRLPERWTGRTVLGHAFDRDCLEHAGIKEAEAFAAVTNGDNTNIVSARIAREHYSVKHVAARIYDPRRAIVYQRLGIPTVATVSWSTDQVMRRLFPEQRSIDWTDPTGSVSLIEVSLPPGWAGKRLDKLEGDGFRVVMVQRAGGGLLVGPSVVGQDGDILHIAVRKDAADELDRVLSGDEHS